MTWLEPRPETLGPRQTPDGVKCPDDGTCHHQCIEAARPCWRVQTCGPLSGVFPGDQWPDNVTAANIEPAKPTRTFTRHDGQEYSVSVGDVVFVTNDYEQRYRDPGWVQAVVARLEADRPDRRPTSHSLNTGKVSSHEDQ